MVVYAEEFRGVELEVGVEKTHFAVLACLGISLKRMSPAETKSFEQLLITPSTQTVEVCEL